ncbi:hypothetical protein [Azoarcus olearius]|uniref:Uncharacterized protein n=1 Tax=Azoarcus sp. (strain BH72) TaxID=418699 RepID=A1K4S4_AZOSB|nr:hypothetical protein [Azoarcus olearius]ANQ84380.1 hypothetical protein dqs_1327 [Azoarcus olearius]CAL93829.1 conserved hypothetical protein [Azoarcus olearius]
MSNETQASTEIDPAEAAAKDGFFERIAAVSEDMIQAYGREFAMGTLLLAARYIAQSRAAEAEPAPQIITQP